MKIQVNTDNHIQGGPELTARTEAAVEGALDRFARQITRVEVHLSDENSGKGGNDKRCVMEARLEGMQPIAVTHQAEVMDQAIDGAADKLEKALDSALGRLSSK
jgi:ribosome-associated translation inhibitor RaiA